MQARRQAIAEARAGEEGLRVGGGGRCTRGAGLQQGAWQEGGGGLEVEEEEGVNNHTDSSPLVTLIQAPYSY